MEPPITGVDAILIVVNDPSFQGRFKRRHPLSCALKPCVSVSIIG